MLNVIILQGRLTTDPELKHTPSGTPVTSFSLAVERSHVTKDKERETDFINAVAWRNTAEFINKYFKRGQMMVLCGSMQTRAYTDKDGKTRKAYEVVVENVHFCGEKQKPEAPALHTTTGGFMPDEDDSEY